MKLISTIVGLAVLLAIAVAVYTGFGFYNVAASRPDQAAVAWWVARTSDSSIQRHADKSAPFPPALDDPAMIQAGAHRYVEDGCVDCHGGVGVPQAAFATGMNPEPPEMVEVADEWDDRELYWIVQNGLRMTGMPAFGASNDPQAIWSLVSFVRLLPTMSEEDYARLAPSVSDQLERKGEEEREGAEEGTGSEGGEAAEATGGEAAEATGAADGDQSAATASDGDAATGTADADQSPPAAGASQQPATAGTGG